ncbi:TPA_asm: hypothetical protein [ssRNA phage Zoerhiza.4_18]|uniref:Uncharacterized protein n=2 Tax=Norzivirales TaxID=2842247 RepID=A0A8S5KXP8_9VIRU|nr:hypothetical protein QIM31_gp1 [ssRNA phage Zoerhiza.4_18]QDH90381.1 MAG: hypothetical protein H4Rhizo45207_000001 [Leviviridae sp.]DAD50145.1 TPA_asm: hypothetical protein [ssRNA phage Zoerhiza.4_18]
MNVFKSLDIVFPSGSARTFGEVVGVNIRVFVDNVDLGEIDMKRKAWYVNASVNAFHMHRSLVRDFTDLVRGVPIRQSELKRAKRLITLAVADAYLSNRKTDSQVFCYYLNIVQAPGLPVVRMTRDPMHAGWVWPEIPDFGVTLETRIDWLVSNFRAVLAA